MAILTNGVLAQVRRDTCAQVTVNFTKPTINAAIQSCEDYFENTARAGFGAAIEAAAPGAFNNAQKKQIGKFWLFSKFGRE